MATVMDRKTTFVVLLVHCYISLATLTCMFAYAGGNPNVLCRKGERDALFTFKKGIIDPSNLLSSWIAQECCTWKGIGCDNITGHVVHLNLRNPYDFYASDDFEQSMLGGLISDSLLELKHLHYLDLSLNNFSDNHFPSFFGCLWNLRYLNLSDAGFMGTIPHQLANLSNLHTLDIRQRFYYMPLQVDNLEWLSHLSLLEFLDMSYVNLSKASNWLQVMNMLPSLSELQLSSCELDKYDPIPYVNFSSLTVLDISYNYFVNSTFDWIKSLTSLVTLDLKYTEIKVPLLGVAVQNMSSLRNLLLSGNNFSYTIPKWLYNMTTLERLYLPGNNIQGVLPKAIGRLSQLILLDLSQNDLEGKIPRFLGNLCNMQHLDLSENNLGGGLYDILGNSSSCTTKNLELLDLSRNQLSSTLPDQLREHKKLSVLSLGGNKLFGPIPVSLGYLSNLEKLSISSNSLEGFVSEEHFSNLTKLRYLNAYSNLLTLQVSTNWVPPFQLQTLWLGSWALGPRFPTWLQSQKDLQRLDFSNASISDVIPSWFWSLCSQFRFMDLSQNQIRGSIPSLSCGGSIDLGSNNFSGPLPNVSSGIMYYLDLSNNSFHGSLSPVICKQNDRMRGDLLLSLDLSKNLLSGEFPD
ncbi:receptor-like protein EIX1 [Alnus glutinosa]|uniref:receptor-like protein EIX1 n=1 Tax=Alnus glutinosa TaxID=3517 RepID=UPI002D788499|nr:receptor-like protein EIX1 [Alnus glutinosa]